MRSLLASAILLALCAVLVISQTPSAQTASQLYEGARLITGDGSAPINDGAVLVTNGRITAVGRRGSFTVPAGAERVDVTGKTIMPTLVNAHVHIGYETYESWGAENYTPDNVDDLLKREAYYGTGTVMSVGSDPVDQALEFQREQAAGEYPGAARLLAVPGMAPPKGGPDEILIEATTALHSVSEVSTPEQARAAVRSFADKNIKFVKLWVDDRRGTYPKMPPEVYGAIIDEAHRHQMKAMVHATTLADQKAVIGAGADLVVHLPYDKPADDEYLRIVKEHNPYIVPIVGLVSPSPLCSPDPFNEELLPASYVANVRKTSCSSPSQFDAIDKAIAAEFPRMLSNNARFILGTDAGVFNWYSFGWAEHRELEWYVQLGMTPAQAIVAATSRPAEMMGLKDTGMLAAGRRADLLVLNANPLENIRNLRQIDSVYLEGHKVNREGLRTVWTRRLSK